MRKVYSNLRSSPLILLPYTIFFLGGGTVHWLLLTKFHTAGAAYTYMVYFLFPLSFIAGIFVLYSELRGSYRVVLDRDHLKATSLLGGTKTLYYREIAYVGERTVLSRNVFSELVIRTSPGCEAVLTWNTPQIGEIIESIIDQADNLVQLAIKPEQIMLGPWRKEPDIELFQAACCRAEENRKKLDRITT